MMIDSNLVAFISILTFLCGFLLGSHNWMWSVMK